MPEGLIGLFLLGLAGLPVILFNVSFLPAALAALSLTVLIMGFALWARRFSPGKQIAGSTIALCFFLSILFCLLGGEIHVFAPPFDWLVRDAILRDLVVAPWPVHYEFKGEDFLLRAPLAMYLAPAAFGKLFGLAAANVALFAQNAAIFGCLLAIFVSRAQTWNERLLILGVFIFFSGLDILPWAKAWLSGEHPRFEWHLEPWAPWLQYSSHLTQLFWVPHHAFAGWGFVAGYLCWRRGQLTALSLGAIFALCLFWSPLAMMGALPFLVFALISDLRAGRFHLSGLGERFALGWNHPSDKNSLSMQNVRACSNHKTAYIFAEHALAPVLIGTGCLPVTAYMILDSAAVVKGWLVIEPGFPLHYMDFLLVELGLWFWIFYITPRREDETFKPADLLIAGVSLLLFPLYYIGVSNDFTMRASIPALAMVALASVPRLRDMLKTPGLRRVILIIGLCLATVTPAVEIIRDIKTPPLAIANCNFFHGAADWSRAAGQDPDQASVSNYLAKTDAGLLSRLLVKPPSAINSDAPCGPGIKIFPFLGRQANSAEPTTAP